MKEVAKTFIDTKLMMTVNREESTLIFMAGRNTTTKMTLELILNVPMNMSCCTIIIVRMIHETITQVPVLLLKLRGKKN